jgi:hypothetical protein
MHIEQHNSFFLVKLDPGKTHKGKTSERGAFYYFRAQRKMSFTAVIIFNKKL